MRLFERGQGLEHLKVKVWVVCHCCSLAVDAMARLYYVSSAKDPTDLDQVGIQTDRSNPSQIPDIENS